VENTQTQPRENKYFHALVMNLQVATLHHLGVIRGEGEDEKGMNLDAARDTIEMLRMLEEKTQGNLNTGEENALEQVLYQVQMAFVEKSSSSSDHTESQEHTEHSKAETSEPE